MKKLTALTIIFSVSFAHAENYVRKRSIERVLPLSRKMGFFNVPR